MEFRDALKALRSELGVTQAELAAALHMNCTTVSRWEKGTTTPNRSASSALLYYANANAASKGCQNSLRQSIVHASKQRLEISANHLASVEHASLRQIIDDASFPLYVCDLKTDDLLYINHKMEELLGGSLDELPSKKCYTCLMHRDKPCEFCHKEHLSPDRFVAYDAFRPDDQTFYRVQGKLISWMGRKAQVRYIFDIAGSVSVSSQREREIAYQEQFRIRRDYMSGAVATAHYNLTHNTVTSVTSKDQALAKFLKSHSVDDIFAVLRENQFSDEDQGKLDSVCDRAAMIKQFYVGKTHISVECYNKRLGGYFESVFDLIQNPVTYDIEAFCALWDVTDQIMEADIADKLFSIDYETITAIDAETGVPRPYVGRHIHDVIIEQKAAGDTVAGVEAYLRKYCVDYDIESVIKATSLPYVKEQLEIKPYHHIAYTLKQGDKFIYKRTMYTYLDKQKTIILCAMQDFTDIHALENVKRDQIASALQTLQEQAGMNVARYDLRTKTFFSNSEMASAIGYGREIKNVPEEFIEKGLIAPACIDDFRRFYEKLKAGEATTITVACRVKDGSYHWLRISSHLVYDREGKPYQAILSFRDIERDREQAAVFKTWRQAIDQRDPSQYTLFRCNLTKDISFERTEGLLLKPERRKLNVTTFNECMRDYAARFVHIDDFDAFTQMLSSESLLAGYLLGRTTASLDFRDLVSEGEYRWLRVTVELAQHPDMMDVEAFLMIEKARKPDNAVNESQADTLHKTAFENTGLTIVKYDCQSRVFTYDPMISERVLGNYDDRPLWEILLTDTVANARDVKKMKRLILELAENPDRTSGTMELKLKTPANTAHWFNFFAIKQIDDRSKTLNIVMTLLDINDDVLASKRLHYQAEHDSLTGLYNRCAFLKLVTQTARGKPMDSYILLCVDINDFSVFNERFGREQGDSLLVYAADLLRSYSQARAGFAGRLSNDIFAAIIPNTPSALDEAREYMRGFLKGYLPGVRITARAGAYIISDPNMTADSMLDMAAMANQAIRGRYDAFLSAYDARMNEMRLREKSIADRMEDSLANGEFDVYFQPQFHAGTGAVVGAEALARWIDPQLGVIEPNEFIPLFEKNGFITKLDEYIWEKTARCLSGWLARGKDSPPISVNVSHADIDDPEFINKLLAIVEKHSIPLPLFRLEITESLFAKNPEHLAQVVNELHEAGFLVEMDDFGSGYSQLNILKNVPVDILKLDMRIFSDDDYPGRGGMIVSAVLRMSRWLGIPVIAEGVEKKEQADFLTSIGCHTIQGFLYEKPMTASQFEKLLDTSDVKIAILQDEVDTKLDKQDFWNPLSADSRLFDYYIGPAVVFEYHGGEYEILRLNRSFSDATGATPDKKQSIIEMLGLGADDIPKFRKAIIEAAYYEKDTKINVRRYKPNKSLLVSRVTLRILAKATERVLFLATLDE